MGDRSMLMQTQIDTLKNHPRLGWISALRSEAIRKLAAAGSIQMSLFDQQNLAEIESPEFPGERLMVCFNPQLAEERGRKRTDLLAAAERELDSIYVIRTSEPAARLSPEDTVRSYKNLSHVERAFRTLEGIDLRVRPIRHRTPDHVRAHIFLCLPAYYVEWHMRKAWAPLLFDDEELDANRKTRDPVAAAKPSRSAKKKKTTRRTTDGLPVHSFETLPAELATRCRNDCRTTTGKTGFKFDQITAPSPLQKRALELLGVCPVRGKST